jgi:energy-converting hydrogenase Eha subunit F
MFFLTSILITVGFFKYSATLPSVFLFTMCVSHMIVSYYVFKTPRPDELMPTPSPHTEKLSDNPILNIFVREYSPREVKDLTFF